jgi:hypothetical protein
VPDGHRHGGRHLYRRRHTTTDVITVSAGNKTLAIPVSVNGTAHLLTGFDRSTSPFTGTSHTAPSPPNTAPTM